MSFVRPTLKEIVERVGADAESRIGKKQLRRSNLSVLSRVLAGAVHGLYGFIEYQAKQLFFDTAESEYLDRWCSIYKIYRKKATKATGKVAFSFSGDPINIPAGTVLQSDDSIQYQTTASPDSKGLTAVEALIAGASGNLEAGLTLSLTSPIAGVISEALTYDIAGGADKESDEQLRSRLLKRVREPPQGGTSADYVAWALEVPGVTRAWCYPMENGEGSVTVRFVCDDYESIIPTEEMVQKVYDYIDAVRPVTCEVTVSAPDLKPVNIVIGDLLPDSIAARAAIESELRDLFIRESMPGQLIYLSHIRAAISTALGEEDHTLVSPTSNPMAGKNELLTLGTIAWQ